MDSFTSDDFKDLSSVRPSGNATAESDSSDFNISAIGASPAREAAVAAPVLDDMAVDSVARSFEKSAKEGFAALEAEDPEFKDPAKVAALFRSQRTTEVFHKAMRAMLGAPGTFAAAVAAEYAELISAEANLLQGELHWLPLAQHVAEQSTPPGGGRAYAVLDVGGQLLFLFDALARSTLVASVDLAGTELRSSAEDLGMDSKDAGTTFGVADAGLKAVEATAVEQRSLLLTATSSDSRSEWMRALSTISRAAPAPSSPSGRG
eukprot:COSAG05_NODE_5644_length_1123_cov_1.205078_1_plen_262_part_01